MRAKVVFGALLATSGLLCAQQVSATFITLRADLTVRCEENHPEIWGWECENFASEVGVNVFDSGYGGKAAQAYGRIFFRVNADATPTLSDSTSNSYSIDQPGTGLLVTLGDSYRRFFASSTLTLTDPGRWLYGECLRANNFYLATSGFTGLMTECPYGEVLLGNPTLQALTSAPSLSGFGSLCTAFACGPREYYGRIDSEPGSPHWRGTTFLSNLIMLPEPGTLTLFGLGLTGLAFARRRKPN